MTLGNLYDHPTYSFFCLKTCDEDDDNDDNSNNSCSTSHTRFLWKSNECEVELASHSIIAIFESFSSSAIFHDKMLSDPLVSVSSLSGYMFSLF